jgi:hypothetical protein
MPHLWQIRKPHLWQNASADPGTHEGYLFVSRLSGGEG